MNQNLKSFNLDSFEIQLNVIAFNREYNVLYMFFALKGVTLKSAEHVSQFAKAM